MDLTHRVDLPPPSLRQPPPAPQQPARGMSVFWAAGVAAVLAFVAVMAVRDPSLLQGRFLLADNQSDNQATLPPPSLTRVDGPPLRVSSPRSGDRTVTLAVVPPPVELTANSPDAAAAPKPAAPMIAAVPPTPVATAPAPSTPPKQTAATTMAPVAPTPTLPTKPKPVQMAALPSPDAPIVVEAPKTAQPEPVVINTRPVETPAVAPAPAMVAPTTAKTAAVAPAIVTPTTVAVAPKPDVPKPIAAIPAQPAPVEKTTQVAMAPTVAPAPPAAPAVKSDGPGAAVAGDARMAAELEKRVKAGDHVAEYRLGILYALGKGVTRDYDHAAQLLRASAESGLAEAEYDYGVLSDKGLGVPRDSAEAARWYAKAAQQGHPPAALNLGYAYAEGLGVVRNLPEAARWFRRAAEAGLINAQFNLAYMYEQGAGVTKSPVDAYAWYSVAAERGDQGAQQAMDRIAVKLTPHELQLAKTRIKTVKHTIRVQH